MPVDGTMQACRNVLKTGLSRRARLQIRGKRSMSATSTQQWPSESIDDLASGGYSNNGALIGGSVSECSAEKKVSIHQLFRYSHADLIHVSDNGPIVVAGVRLRFSGCVCMPLLNEP